MLVEPHSQTVAADARQQPTSQPALLRRLVGRIRAYLKHRRDRQELFEYLASAPRAAADLGISQDILRGWSRRPFWRA